MQVINHVSPPASRELNLDQPKFRDVSILAPQPR